MRLVEASEEDVFAPVFRSLKEALCAACDERVLDIVGEIFGSPNIELFGNGQLVYKEPGGGHAVNLHQDAAFFEFGGSGLSPIGTLNYCVDTNCSLNNGPLTVFPLPNPQLTRSFLPPLPPLFPFSLNSES